MMREIFSEEVVETVAELCRRANCFLSADVKAALYRANEREKSPAGKAVFRSILKNIALAEAKRRPLCQDTGMAVVFLEIGQDVHLRGLTWEEAVNAGVAKGYCEGYMRKSVVRHPLQRDNTGNNTPAIIHYQMVAGDEVKITVAPKGFGSENMSAVRMLKPAQGIEAVKDFVVETVKSAGPNPCPPTVVGVGIGGTMEKAAYLAKKALLRPLGKGSADAFDAALEQELLCRLNGLGIGPQGFGGEITSLFLAVETYPTHIAGLPVAVNINCHVARHAEKTI